MTTLSDWGLVLGTIGFLFAFFEICDVRKPLVRSIASGLCAALTIRYIGWRLCASMPDHQNVLQTAWAWLFAGTECVNQTGAVFIYFFMSRTKDRSEEATAHRYSDAHSQPVDVFIATYNESKDILERTIVGALALDHPDLRVWVLDDGNRDWLREYATSLGVQYVSRVKGKHAKAGNVNNGVQHALASDRPPAFFLLLDADFVPHRTLLTRALSLFHDPGVGIVQTPQHFFNHDPIQSNLLCSSVWPDEQRFFFNCLMPSRDAWGAAFCCGTSAVFRTEAFVKAQGMATETVTEDMLTTFRFQEHGYSTVFLNERLSLGLAPESLGEFISQRSRWCLGAIQQIFTRWSFWGPGKISLINRVGHFDTVFYWMSGSAFKIMVVLAPILYWFTGTAVLHASGRDLVNHLVPMMAANMLFMYYMAGNRVLPLMTDISHLLTSVVILRTVLSGLVRPFGRPFKVTAKGLSSSSVTVQWRLLAPFACAAAATILGVAVHAGSFDTLHGSAGYTTNVIWSLTNAAMLALAALVCIEFPRRRRDERFVSSEPVRLRLSGFSDEEEASESSRCEAFELACELQDLSLGGARLLLPEVDHALAGPATLLLYSKADQTTLHLPIQVVTRSGRMVRVQFLPDAWIRHALIRKLFTGEYHKDVENISIRGVLLAMMRVLTS